MTSKKSKLGKNPFEKPAMKKRKLSGTGAAPPKAEAAPPREGWRLERLAFFRFENLGETAPSLSLLSVAVKLPFWKRSRNHFEFKILRRPISLNLLSVRIQQG